MAAAEAMGVSDLRIARVWDATAVRGSRVHEIGGRNWTFIPGEPRFYGVEVTAKF